MVGEDNERTAITRGDEKLLGLEIEATRRPALRLEQQTRKGNVVRVVVEEIM